MQITSNTTPYLAELFVSTDKHGRKHCVVVVKATFDVGPDSQCHLADEQRPFVYADKHQGDPGMTSIQYESDFAPIKPCVDVLLSACAVAPAQKQVASLEVAFAGPGINKQALVCGDRVWLDGLSGVFASDPQPFYEMPVTWDRAFGGSDQSHEDIAKNGSELRNLVGTGFHLNNMKETIVGKPLPNVERPGAPIRSWSDRPEPIGFGPLGRGWQPRIAFAGTYDQRWMDERLPFLPEDFDDRYFQSAPLDQQIRALPSDATFDCLNMNAEGRFVVRLPSFRVPVRYFFEERTEALVLSPDTVILEPNVGKAVLVGRVSVPLPRKFTTLREIQVGSPKRQLVPGKPHFSNPGDAVATFGTQG